jgi:isoleucyl-tRNA synthetase
VKETFITGYQKHIKDAESRLGKLFDKQNYPSVEDLRYDCAFKIIYLPVPAYTDIRVADAEVQQHMVDAISQAYTGLVMSLADQMYDEVKSAHDQLLDGERFRIERIDRLQEMVSKVRTYNMTNDPRVDQSLALIEEHVIGELNSYIDTRNRRNVGKDDKELAKQAALKKLSDVGENLAGLFA